MKVYLLWHSDIEDARYVRGVFSNEEGRLGGVAGRTQPGTQSGAPRSVLFGGGVLEHLAEQLTDELLTRVLRSRRSG